MSLQVNGSAEKAMGDLKNTLASVITPGQPQFNFTLPVPPAKEDVMSQLGITGPQISVNC